ncbi:MULTISPECIES: FxSxx-COOH system tetratricopeptide repeat protein [Streptomyces]|uniref:FxSxx-COOH system tetratricopeptide repeat protein n=1 Tax=Streptomyces TaxID=1883 RepID=UPI000A435082|nr:MULTISPECIES: FxSxx-COOH system tetratricopeptide repeat protein [Streptomyces]
MITAQGSLTAESLLGQADGATALWRARPIDSGGNPHLEERAVVLSAAAKAATAWLSAPPGLHNLPAAKDGLIGRTDALQGLRESLTSGAGVICQAAAVHGLGGVGKTTLALHYAHTHLTDYPLVWWITAESEEHIASALADLAVRIYPDWALDAGARERTEWAVRWLQAHPGWLIVYDNVNDPLHVNPFLSRLFGHGHQLVTSRRRAGWRAGTHLVSLDVLSPRLAVDLLCDVAFPARRPTPAERRQAGLLASDLGHLPLALAQAAAYVRETGMSFASYRSKLAATAGDAPRATTPSEELDRAITQIWLTSSRAIGERCPVAVELLMALAWYAPEALPVQVLTSLADSEAEGRTAVDMLADYNLVSMGGDSVSLHRLMQKTLRTAASVRAADIRGRAERALAGALPDTSAMDGEAERGVWQQWLPHIQALAQTGPSSTPHHEVTEMYRRAADELVAREQHVLAIPLVECVVENQLRLLGSDDSATLADQDRLAGLHAKAGDPAKAVRLCQEAFRNHLRLSGGDARSTLDGRHRLAYAYRKAGDLLAAVREFEAVVADRRRVLGEDHPDTLTSRNDLAYARQMAGQYRQAVKDFEAVVADRRRILGDDHPDTLTSRNNLAYAHRRAGDHQLALRLYEQAVADRERVLGADHPDTLTSRGWLASAHEAAGNQQQAVSLYTALRAERGRVQG